MQIGEVPQIRGVKTALIAVERALDIAWRFLRKYWIVWIAVIPLGFLLQLDCVSGRSLSIGNAWKYALGRDTLFVGEWWYVSTYLGMLCMYPVLCLVNKLLTTVSEKHIIRQFVLLIAVIGVCAGVLVWRNDAAYGFAKKVYSYMLNHVYFLIFAEGWFIAFFDFEKRLKVSEKGSLFHIIVVILCIIVRVAMASSAAYNLIDPVIIAPFAISTAKLISRMPKAEALLCFFGRYSTYMWLTHSVICYHYLQEAVAVVPVSTAMFFVLIVLSFSTAYVLTKAEKLLCKGCNRLVCKIRSGLS